MPRSQNPFIKNPRYIQFGSAGWFWEQSVNTFQIKVVPEREKCKDSLNVRYGEDLWLEKVRDMVIKRLATIARKNIRLSGNGWKTISCWIILFSCIRTLKQFQARESH